MTHPFKCRTLLPSFQVLHQAHEKPCYGLFGIPRMSGDLDLGWFGATGDRWLPSRAKETCATRLSRTRGTTEAVGIQHVLQCEYSFKFMDIGTADHRQSVELCRAHSLQRQTQGLVGMQMRKI
jgi:hypothetical protein